MTPYYDQDGITIYHADCRDVLPALPPVDLVLTDPPYGFSAYETDVPVEAETLANIVRMAPRAAVFGYPELLAAWCVDMRLKPSEWVVWWPTNPMRWRDPHLQRESEHIAVFGELNGRQRLRRPVTAEARRIGERMGKPKGETAALGDVWRDAKPGMGFLSSLRLHPNEKPLDVMRRLVALASETDDLVFDPFMGSGTTLRAAKDLGRRAIGIEIEERYCEIAVKRLAQMVLPLEAA